VYVRLLGQQLKVDVQGLAETLGRQYRGRRICLTEEVEEVLGEMRSTASTPAEKSSTRGGGGRKAALAAIEAVLVAKGVPDKQREAVMDAATGQAQRAPVKTAARTRRVAEKRRRQSW